MTAVEEHKHQRLRRRAIIVSAALMVVLGAAPLAYVMWLGSGDRLEPLSMPLSLAPGEYTSPLFATDLDKEYQIQLYFLPYVRTPIDLDWKIVDAHGKVMDSGHYRDQETVGNSVNLGQYRPERGLRQRAIVDMHEGTAVSGADMRLHIGLPEEILGLSYGFPLAALWCLVVSGSGIILLLILWVRTKRQIPHAGHETVASF